MILRSDTSDTLSRLNHQWGKQMLAKLQQVYPQVAVGWDISINQGGIVFIRNTLLAGRMGCCLRTINIAPDMKEVISAGGELLERYRVARSRAISERAILDSIAEQPENQHGDLIADT